MSVTDNNCVGQESQQELDNSQDLELCAPADETYAEPCKQLYKAGCGVWNGDAIPAYGIEPGDRLTTIILKLIAIIDSKANL